ncbi:MAG: hypothetical protein U0401_16130 [Anaerolineae bacterium]
MSLTLNDCDRMICRIRRAKEIGVPMVLAVLMPSLWGRNSSMDDALQSGLIAPNKAYTAAIAYLTHELAKLQPEAPSTALMPISLT